MHPKIAIVIPYFQRRSGILRKALDSVLSQRGIENFDIIVVDDESPVPPHGELPDESKAIRIVRQRNAGPAAARNAALSNVSSDTEYVAFLDSDDAWTEDHLVRALNTLERGYDFYFADFYHMHQQVSAFKRAERINIPEHRLLSGERDVHEYSGDLFNQILTGNIIGTSTVVYRFPKFRKLRFREEFVYVGEDYLFWMEIARRTRQIAFSSRCECRYGEGVNVFSGSGWGTEKSLIRTHQEMKFLKALPRLFSLNGEQARHVSKNVKRVRLAFIRDLIHRLRHGKPIERNILKGQWRADPASFLLFLPIAASIFLGRD